jgi:hypothetical protein
MVMVGTLRQKSISRRISHAYTCITNSSSDILGYLSLGILTHQENAQHLRPLPLTDRELDPEAYLLDPDGPPWHGDDTSYVPGLNSLSDLFLVWHDMQQQTQPKPLPDIHPARETYLSRVQKIIDELPPELRWRGGLSRPAGVTLGHDVQVANLFVTSLHIRSNVLQRYPDADNGRARAEHQRVVDDLLEVLYHMPQAVFDANGSSVVAKVRDVGAAYLEQVRAGMAGEGQGEAGEKMERLLRKLDSLDYRRPEVSRAWLREAAENGVL